MGNHGLLPCTTFSSEDYVTALRIILILALKTQDYHPLFDTGDHPADVSVTKLSTKLITLNKIWGQNFWLSVSEKAKNRMNKV